MDDHQRRYHERRGGTGKGSVIGTVKAILTGGAITAAGIAGGVAGSKGIAAIMPAVANVDAPEDSPRPADKMVGWVR